MHGQVRTNRLLLARAPDNHNVIVITYYNEAVDLLNGANGDRGKLIRAEQHLTKAREHVDFASNGVQELSRNIEDALAYLKKYLH